jgi:hypothetical protein
VPSVSRAKGPIHLGLDVHKDSISVGILRHPALAGSPVLKNAHGPDGR